MGKQRVAVIGYGHIGQAAVQALAVAADMELAGVVDRPAVVDEWKQKCPSLRMVDRLEALERVETALLCIPSRSVPEVAPGLLRQGVNTVDCFDIHGDELDKLRTTLNAAARETGTVAVTACGWDPGLDSVIRGLFLAVAPRGLTYTNHGPGVSMGHTVAARAIPGVADAMSVTVPIGAGLHRRVVYVVLSPGAELPEVTGRIRRDPYFSRDELTVVPVASVDELFDMGHGVVIERKGVSGQADNQLFRYESRINNPALTTQIMVAGARAARRMPAGCHTLLDIPVAYLLDRDPGVLAHTVV